MRLRSASRIREKDLYRKSPTSLLHRTHLSLQPVALLTNNRLVAVKPERGRRQWLEGSFHFRTPRSAANWSKDVTDTTTTQKP
jgi:hypothetical protein